MKKVIYLGLLILTQISLAQDKKNDSSPDRCQFYVGVGAGINSHYKIDDLLQASGMPQPATTLPDFSFGINFLTKNWSIDEEIASNGFKKTNVNNSVMGGRFSFRMRGHYNFINNEKMQFSTGLNLAYATNDLSIYANNNQVDLNNMAASSASYIRLRNGMFYAGPSIGFGIKKKDNLICRLNVGYEVAILSGKWKSDYANVSNSINEVGQNRLMVGVIAYIGKSKRL